MLSEEFVLNNEMGLHARPASKFVKIANSYKSKIEIIKGDKRYNGKSIVTLLSLGLKSGSEITIEVDGDDENTAIEAIKKLVENNFDD